VKSDNFSEIKSIAIVGSGLDLWMSSAFLLRMIGLKDVRICAIELPVSNRLIQSSLPVLKSFNKLLKIDERELIKKSQSNINLATAYVNWSYEGQAYYQAYIDNDFSLNGFQLFQYLIKANFIENGFSYDDFNISAQSAKNGRFAHKLPGKIESSYGYQFNSDLLAQIYKYRANSNGVAHYQASEISVDKDGTNISAIYLDGQKMAFDLYVDCSVTSTLMDSLNNKKVQLSELDTRITLSKNNSILDPSVCISSAADGISIKKSDLNSSQTSFICENNNKDKYLNSISDKEDIKNIDIREEIAFYRERFWVGNCISIGSSACNFHGLISAESWLLHSALQKIVNLYPRTSSFECESKEFNRLALQQCERIAAYYMANLKVSRCNIEINSKEVDHKLNLFKARGEIPFYEGETYSADFWRGLLFGAKMFPDSSSYLVEGADDQWLISELSKIKDYFKKGAQEVPRISDYLKRYIGA
jgi:tryptophan 7-halogenase